MFGYIYKTTDKTNGKIYIGKHRSETFQDYKYIGSGQIIKNIINKCEENNIPLQERFNIEMIDTANSLEELNEKEIYWINKLNARDKNIGYNLTCGGDGGVTTLGKIKINNGIKEIMINLNDELPCGFKIGCLNAGKNHPSFGVKYHWCTNGEIEFRLNINDNLPDGFKFGRLPISDEQKLKISQNHNTYRENFSEETLEKFRQNWTGKNNPNAKNPKFGADNPFFGKHHSEHAKLINSIKHKIKYKCPFCDYVNNKGSITKHINKIHKDLIKSASTIENITYEKYIGE